MDIADLAVFVGQNHRAVLATSRKSGRPQLSPVVVAWGSDGRLLISTRAATAKARNIRRDPRVSICAMNDGFFGQWAQVDGNATIVELPAAMPLLRYVYTAIAGEHEDWDEFERDMVTQGRVVISVQPEGTGPQKN